MNTLRPTQDLAGSFGPIDLNVGIPPPEERHDADVVEMRMQDQHGSDPIRVEPEFLHLPHQRRHDVAHTSAEDH